MKTNQKMLLAALAMTAGLSGYAAVPVVSLGNAVATEAVADLKAVPSGSLVINGTGNSATFTINAQNLTEQIRLTATPGLEVYPEVLPAGAANATVRVTLLSTLPQTKGQVFLRSGDYRAVMNVLAYGTELEQKDLTDPVFTGSEKKFEAREADGFKPGDKGYTVEFRVKHSKPIDTFEAFAVTPGAGSFMTYVEPELMGVYNGTSRVNIENPLNDKDGGKKSFYNKDGKFHTYRFAVTSDKRMFVYRDGVQVATLRTGDYGEQADWAVENGDVVENLLKNGNFEGEWNTRADSLVNRVEGWIVDPIDRYNCTYEVPNYEINNDLDYTNHVMKLQRYNWNDGWGAGTVSQIVNVAPNSTYSLSFLAGGGMNTKTGEIMSSVKIQEVQNDKLGTSVKITNEEGLEQYGLNYTTSADCKQIKVILHNERFLNGGGWGSSPKAFLVDEMALAGTSRVLDQKVGFARNGATVEYFTYDATGAYAPVAPVLEPEQSAVVIEGAGQSKRIKINIANLVSVDKVQVSATAGFSVMPEVLSPSKNGEIMVTLNSTLPQTDGKIILRAGDIRSYISLTGYADELEARDIKESPAYAGGSDNAFVNRTSDGFTAGENGYTVEFRVKVDKAADAFSAYAVTPGQGAFKAYVEPSAMGVFNGATQVSLENPATAEDGGNKKFYNNDGKFHTYRVAVTADKRMNIYRDGMHVANLRTSDYGTQADWAVENGDVAENLLKNSGFEGEWNTRADGLVNRVEGWFVDPIDRYNCEYSVINYEINNDLDHNNHVMKLQRYNWNDGWGAGTVSQIVDVAPNSTYSLSFLAGGGMNTKTGEIMSSVKIQEVQNDKLGTSVKVTNEEGLEQYGLNYTTSADCKQIKVILHNERFLNGGGWGSSPKAFLVDEMVLTGTSRVLDQKVGFENTGANVEYFAYDMSGAYAPLAPGFGDDFSGVEETVAANAPYYVAAAEGIAVYNVGEGASLAVYDAMGVLVASQSEYLAGTPVVLPRKGMYVCVVTDAVKAHSLKVVY